MAKIKDYDVLVYDIEVFKKNFMLVFKNSESGEYYLYSNNVEEGIKLSREKVECGIAPPIENLINDYWLCGYNNFSYDNIMITAMLKNPYPVSVKLRNDSLFKHMKENNEYNRTKPKSSKRRFTDSKRFPVFRAIKSIDAMQEIVADEFKDNMNGIPLKFIESNLGLNIHETPISFDIDRELTEEEIKLVMEYCINDVDVTEMVMNARWEDYFLSKIYLCEMIKDWSFEFSMTMRTTTLTGNLLKNSNKFDFNGMLDKLYEDELMLPSMYEYWKKGYSREAEDDDGLTLELFDNIIKFKWGGLHGVHRAKKYFEGKIWHIDVASMYPSIIILLEILGEEVTQLYKQLREERVANKHRASELKKTLDDMTVVEELLEEIDKLEKEIKLLGSKANGAKLILNKLYGILGSDTSKVSNIKGLNAICVYGQTAMYNIGLLVSPFGEIIQFNTDGIYFMPNEGVTKDDIINILQPWEEQFGLEMDIEDYVNVAQRDVNTYIATAADGELKLKGEISTAKDKWHNMFKNWSGSIVEKAVVELVARGTPIHVTVNNETDLRRFMYTNKSTKAFRGVINLETGEEEQQHINRFFVVHCGGASYGKVKVIQPDQLIKRKLKLESKIVELEKDLPEYLADKEVFKTKKELSKKWKTGPEKKIQNAQDSLDKINEQLEAIEGGQELVTYSKVPGIPEEKGKTLLYNGDIRTDDSDLLFKIDRGHYIDAAIKLASKFGV